MVYLIGNLGPSGSRSGGGLLADPKYLPPATGEEFAKRLAGLLEAWTVPNTDERSRLVQQLLAEAVIENGTVVAVKPRPSSCPALRVLIGTSTETTGFEPAR